MTPNEWAKYFRDLASKENEKGEATITVCASLASAADQVEKMSAEIEQKSKRIGELENALQYLQSRFLIHAEYCQAIHRRADLYGDIGMPVCNKCGQTAPSHDFGCDGEWVETTKNNGDAMTNPPEGAYDVSGHRHPKLCCVCGNRLTDKDRDEDVQPTQTYDPDKHLMRLDTPDEARRKHAESEQDNG